jgi:AGZA family xanthine/uracil permease-like MFS transporter
MTALDRFFALSAQGTTVRRELLAGVTTFLTMAYIIFVQPAVLSVDFAGRPTGLDFGAVLLATCLGAAIGSLVMGLYANYPLALAPGMGENFFFVSVIMTASALGFTSPWQTALGVVFLAGVVFWLLSLFGVREAILNAISPSMRNGIAVGIGLFIAFIGLRNAGLVIAKPGSIVGINPHLFSADIAVFVAGFLVAAGLQARRVRGAILWGILVAAGVALALGKISFGGVVGLPQVHQAAVFRMDILGALTAAMLPFVAIFVFMDVFDTVGTLIGVAEQAGFTKGGTLPRANRVLMADATATVAGACLGTSTVTVYIESAAGVAAGGRTGLTAVFAGLLFLVALLFSPLVGMIGNYLPITAPALVIVGSLMIRNVTKIDWDDASEAVPAFLTVIGIPLFYSIADGLALGFVSYPIVKLLAGRGGDVRWLTYGMAALLVVYFLALRGRLA